RLRTFQTRVGHKIQFIEDGGVLVETNGGHKIYLEDSSNSISIKSTGDLKIDAKNIDITASAVMNLKGIKMININ
ncbi:MAG: type IV secretion protein Rhs, partial [Elainellaceae cyanobacterium]